MDTDNNLPLPTESFVQPQPEAEALNDFRSMLEQAKADGVGAGLEHRVIVPTVATERNYPSLYDGQYTTIVAVLLGLVIVGGIQALAWQIYRNAKTDYRALTQFVTMMVGLVLGAYMADLLIAGPSTSLLSDDEHTVILGFVKDICLMVFSYYFGTRSNGGKPESE